MSYVHGRAKLTNKRFGAYKTMLKLGGSVGYELLNRITKRLGTETKDYYNNDPFQTSTLERKFGPSIFATMRGARVVDFGCGRGADVVRLALGGAALVYGLDVTPEYLDDARRCAVKHGVADRCIFLNPLEDVDACHALAGCADYVISVDAFEHFADPNGMLVEMHRLLKPGGSLYVNFGPPWYHPYGAHMGHFCRLPWIHLLFTESTVMAVRSQYASDDARSYEEAAMVNRMTVERFERLIAESHFDVGRVTIHPMRGLTAFTKNRLTREYFASELECTLVKPVEKRTGSPVGAAVAAVSTRVATEDSI
jgi:2-polyprenyl-3-methyl-5-hydroxy-6-metoxy-1,4-benzoquinol methylase